MSNAATLEIPNPVGPETDYDAQARREHNRIVSAWQQRHERHSHGIRRDETAILALVNALDVYVGATIPDPYTAQHIIAPLLEAIDNALNTSIGRLHPGHLSDHARHLATRGGLDSHRQWAPPTHT